MKDKYVIDTPEKLDIAIMLEYMNGGTGIDIYALASSAYEYATATNNAALASAAEKELSKLNWH